MGVVEIQRMRQRTVQECRAGRGIARGVAEHAGIAGRPCPWRGPRPGTSSALRVVPGADDVADEIEHEEARATDDLRGSASSRIPAVNAESVAVTPMDRSLRLLASILPQFLQESKDCAAA